MNSGQQLSSLTEQALDWLRAYQARDARRPIEVTPTTDLLQAGVLDSLGFIQLIAFLESQTGRVFDLSEVEPDVFSTAVGLCTTLLGVNEGSGS